MKLSNELFIRAIHWLYENEGVKGQKELSELTGITETTLSRIMNDKVQQPSIITIQKLMRAFPGVFNPSYFSGQSSYMLMEDYLNIRPDIEKPKRSVQPSEMNIAIEGYKKALEQSQIAIDSKNSEIESLKQVISTQSELIASLRQQIASYNIQPDKYPFPIGVAEKKINVQDKQI